MKLVMWKYGILALVVLGISGPLYGGDEPQLPDRVGFNRHVRPVLSNNCFLCHGPDKNTREAGLRLDVREAAIAARDGVRAIVPGDAAGSALVARIHAADPNRHMPPVESERRLTPYEMALLTRWVDQGAPYEAHWAYIAPERPALPETESADWATNPVDRFVLGKLEKEGLKPSPAADRVTLVRRLSFDLTGLPPTPDEVHRFVIDPGTDAYERLVERLLASPHFGERLAIHWLDLVRYADTVGYHGDQPRGMAPYRDYVIDAFNGNMPFDQFTREQLAGDLLENPTLAQRIASGYNRLNMVTREGGAQDQDYLVRYAADRTRTTASVWLGSSLGCAQCHDHKFDPFTAKDFYRFSAFFADIKEDGVQSERGNEGPFPPFISFPTEAEAAKLAALDQETARLQAIVDGSAEAEKEGARKALRKLQSERNLLETAMETSAVTETMTPRMTRVLNRGNFLDESGEVVTPGIPAFLGEGREDGTLSTRLDLAAWLTDRDNPLTARVFVNRLWKLYFGTGISRVLDDLGSQGEWPKNPELLDYLAVEFMESGWDIKNMVKLIVMSSAYRQSSLGTPALKERDPYNRLVARQSRVRLEAELVRDNALKVSGLLAPEIGGRSVFPYQPAGYYRELNFPEREYVVDTGRNLYRRGVYTHWQRTFLHPSLLAFDAPTREECTAERPVSNSPQQALALLNDPVFVEAARVFAERILREGGGSVDSRIDWAYLEALSRPPLETERAVLAALLEKHQEEYAGDREAAAAFIQIGAKPVAADVDPVELAAWSSVSRTLLNLHEMLYRY